MPGPGHRSNGMPKNVATTGTASASDGNCASNTNLCLADLIDNWSKSNFDIATAIVAAAA